MARNTVWKNVVSTVAIGVVAAGIATLAVTRPTRPGPSGRASTGANTS
jgi:hypothetical protein